MENNNKPILIKIGTGVSMPDLIKVKDYSNNKDYLGHNSEGIPVFLSEKINEKEIKKIMATEIKKLKDGNYEAIVRQVYSKHGKTNGVEDANRDILLLELDVKGENDYHYITFFMKGYSDKQMEISQLRIKDILEKFGISVIEELENKEITLSVRTTEDGFVHEYVGPRREYFDWSKELKHDGECTLPCNVLKFYKTKKGNKYNFIVQVAIDGKEITEFVNYDLDNEYRRDSFSYVLKKLEITEADADKDLNKPAKLVVKRVTKGETVFFNKRITFDKPVKEHYWK